jgi:uncharacterized repeat protein (TIGR03806 family)
MSFDPETGRLWVGDVGQDLWATVCVVQKGGNYGWSVQEGTHPYHPHKKAGPGPILPPVAEHHHSECRSITGGLVYHGDRFPELRGAYVYGDYQYGKIWGLRYDGQKVTWHKELADTTVFITSFAVSRDGQIYVVDYNTGFLNVLERVPAGSATSTFPRLLSEAGLFTSVKDQQVAPGVIPYSVNAPCWSDGAQMERYLALPGTSQFSEPGDPQRFGPSRWGYPDGMVAVQTLLIDWEEGNPRSRAPVETRILLKQDDHWTAYAYLWNDARADATLVAARGTQRRLAIKDLAAPGGIRSRTWQVPSRDECMYCHARASAFLVGLSIAQLNKDHDYGGVVDNQLRALDHIGIFKSPLTATPGALPRYVNPYDETADLELRARTYLHVNCSICHVDHGGGNSFIELGFENTLEATKAVGGRPIQGTFGITDARIIAPGAPDRSVLYYRMASLGGGHMPRVGPREVDAKALELIDQWITRMPNPQDSAVSRAERAETAALLKLLQDGSATASPARAAAIGILTATSTRALALLRAVAHETLPAAVRREVIAATRDQPAIEVRDLFERFIPESERMARLGDRINPSVILDLKGDTGRGRALFASGSSVNCKGCHSIDGLGVEIGPDLSKIGAKYPRPELLQHILEPARSVDPKYVVYYIETKSGAVYSGLLVERNEQEVVVRDAQNQRIRIVAADVEALHPVKQSLMPDFLLRSLTAQQAADLLDYLASLK